MLLDTATDMNDTLNTGDNFDTDTNLVNEKKFMMDLVVVIMRACIYLLSPFYLRNLLFP